MKKSELKEYIREIILAEISKEDVANQQAFNKELEKTAELTKQLATESEEEPTEAEIRKEKSLTKAQTEYTKLTKELKSNVGKIKDIIAKKPTERTKTEELLLAKMKELTQRKNQLKTKFSQLEDED